MSNAFASRASVRDDATVPDGASVIAHELAVESQPHAELRAAACGQRRSKPRGYGRGGAARKVYKEESSEEEESDFEDDEEDSDFE